LLKSDESMYQDMPMSERMDRIGELLAKGIYLHMKKEEEAKRTGEEKSKVNQGRLQQLSSLVNEGNK
jgi:hypothetical protein